MAVSFKTSSGPGRDRDGMDQRLNVLTLGVALAT
jgi:hypothetical protein